DDVMTALNQVALPEFEGVTDRLEQRSIILRPLPEWNFTRGDYETLTSSAGLTLSFDGTAAWLPAKIQDSLLAILNRLLDPAEDPSATWGVHPFDWYHCHLGVWSGSPGVAVSPKAKSWTDDAVGISRDFGRLRAPCMVGGYIPEASIPGYTAAYRAKLA